jgi:4'-phosphopantetheinyl transferase
VLDVWHVDLSRASDEGLWELLCAQERARAAQIVDARRQALWARSRGVLRLLLARYLDAEPRALRFAYGAHGKPALRPPARAGEGEEEEEEEPGTGAQARADGPGTDLRFNLSHSGTLALVAVSVGREVGVDVERARERHTAAFLRAWTLREATAKCLGAGLGAATGEGEGEGEGAPGELWTAELDVGPRAAAAVAVEGGEACELRYWDTPPELRASPAQASPS